MNQDQSFEPIQSGKKSNTWLWIVFVFVLLGGIVYFGWQFSQKSKTKTLAPTSNTATLTTPTLTKSSQDLTTADSDLNSLNSDFDQLDKIDTTNDEAPAL